MNARCSSATRIRVESPTKYRHFRSCGAKDHGGRIQHHSTAAVIAFVTGTGMTKLYAPNLAHANKTVSTRRRVRLSKLTIASARNRRSRDICARGIAVNAFGIDAG